MIESYEAALAAFILVVVLLVLCMVYVVHRACCFKQTAPKAVLAAQDSVFVYNPPEVPGTIRDAIPAAAV